VGDHEGALFHFSRFSTRFYHFDAHLTAPMLVLCFEFIC